jgi:diadenylate cyclase
VTEILWVVSRVTLLDVVDILLVALVFFGLLLLMRGTQAVSLLRGVIVLVVSAFLVSKIFRLTAFSWLISGIGSALLVVVPIVLQPELRRAFERLGRPAGLVLWSGREAANDRSLEAIALAARWLSPSRPSSC